MFRENIPEVHEKILKSVRNNDRKSIEKLATRYMGILEFQYPHPYDEHTILIIACNDKNSMHTVSGDTIRQLIDLGASLTEPTENDHWEAIHYAAINSNIEKLIAVLEYLTYEGLNSLVYCSRHVPRKYPFAPQKDYMKSYSNNALNIILKFGRRNEQFRDCCELLIESGVSVHQADSNGIRPLDLMKEDEQFSEIIERLNLEETKGKEAFELLTFGSEEEFGNLELREGEDIDGPNEDLSSCTLLQLSCAKGLTSCVENLLGKGISPNTVLKKNPNLPIMIAIKEDHEEIVQLLLENSEILLPDDILITMQIEYVNMNMARIDKYMELFINHLRKCNKENLRFFLQATDMLGRTALHYATLYRSSENILELLLLGASLTEKDIFGHSPLNSIEPSVLERFFDNCVNIPEGNDGISNMVYVLQNRKQKFFINYETLINGGNDETQESEFLFQLIKLKNLSHLMNHPVISSYLEVKWPKFRLAVTANLAIYLVAYVSLLLHGFVSIPLPQIFNSVVSGSLVLLLARMLFQFIIFRFDFLKRLDSYVDLVLIAGIGYIMSNGWDNDTYEVFFLYRNLRVAFSVVFLCSTLGIFLQLGNFAFFTAKVIILRQISINFCKYMIFYSIPLLAFCFCFYMLRESSNQAFSQTLYDVVTMFAGDPDSTYPQHFQENPIFSHIIYVFFLVLIGFILQNLLIGLAVSDLQEMKKEAEFIYIKERANYITNMERVVFESYARGKWIEKFFYLKLLQKLRVFPKGAVLVIEPYNNGCVYVKEKPDKKWHIGDANIINLLQNIIKDLALRKDKNTESPYSSKSLHERLERIESKIDKLGVK